MHVIHHIQLMLFEEYHRISIVLAFSCGRTTTTTTTTTTTNDNYQYLDEAEYHLKNYGDQGGC